MPGDEPATCVFCHAAADVLEWSWYFLIRIADASDAALDAALMEEDAVGRGCAAGPLACVVGRRLVCHFPLFLRLFSSILPYPSADDVPAGAGVSICRQADAKVGVSWRRRRTSHSALSLTSLPWHAGEDSTLTPFWKRSRSRASSLMFPSSRSSLALG